jgi:hypothetical protein
VAGLARNFTDADIRSWVSHSFPPTVIDGVIVYDLGGTGAR